MNYVLKNQEGLLPAGHVIASNQLVLKEYEAPALEIANAKETNLDVVEPEIRTENYNYLVVEGENFTIEFNKRTGYLSIYQVNGVDYIKEGEALVPNFWRAPTDNDFGANLQQKYVVWKNPAIRLTSLEGTQENGCSVSE